MYHKILLHLHYTFYILHSCLYRYHLGTAALGSLVIAIVSFIRAVILYIEKKLKVYADNFVSIVYECIVKVYTCILFIEYVGVPCILLIKFTPNTYTFHTLYTYVYCIHAQYTVNLLHLKGISDTNTLYVLLIYTLYT